MALSHSEYSPVEPQQANTAQGQKGNLKALWILSGFAEEMDPQELSSIICEAPDPETACRVITKHISTSSDVLQDKWRKVISQTWLEYHETASSALTIPLSSLDVAGLPIFQDVHAFMNMLREEPVKVVYERDGWVIDSNELERVIKAIPSFANKDVSGLEHEWNYIPLRRLRALMQAVRLVRVYGGKLHVVESRYARFASLPLPQQYYVLWHTDVYHVDWEGFAGQWRQYLKVMQSYLPLIWEMTDELNEGDICSAESIVQACIEAFSPMWEQEVEGNNQSLRHLYQRSGLPVVLDRLLVRDILERYGLVKPEQSVDMMFRNILHPDIQEEESLRVTKAGETILRAEREEDLPCATDILS